MKKGFLLKLAAFVLTLALIAASAVPAFAEKSVSIKVEIAGNDGLLYVRLTAPEGSDISTFSAALKYDDTKLKFNNVSFLEATSIASSKNSDNSGIAVASTVIAESLTEESKIFTYIFKILDDAEGSCEFTFDNVAATDSANNEMNITFNGPLNAVISELEPLTPDVIQSTFEPTTVSEPAESSTEPQKENVPSPNVPITTSSTRTILIISFLMVVLLICIIAFKKKKNES